MQNLKNEIQGIQPFNEVFYIESLYIKTNIILSELGFYNEICDNPDLDFKENHELILSLIQNIIKQVAGISRFFWPSKNSAFYKIRAKKLREVYNIDDSCPIKNREMRNLIEHFDERLDLFLNEFGTKKIAISYVGKKPINNDPTILFRGFFYDEFIFKVLNEEYELKPIIEEINRIHQILLIQRENGRF
ncbi:hypothetical protein [Flavobacterium sp. HNIBRBA15423]|uniref:hypothetical protein n=1 Tax=Flavobacterium sp. HNIBRBA15423 TaxID=3458683 RepID=UPI004044B0BD